MMISTTGKILLMMALLMEREVLAIEDIQGEDLEVLQVYILRDQKVEVQITEDIPVKGQGVPVLSHSIRPTTPDT